MKWLSTSVAFVNAIVVATAARMQYRDPVFARNSTDAANVTTGIYRILRAEIIQATVNVAADNSTLLTSHEDFTVVAQGINPGARPVRCSAGWNSLFAVYPVRVPLSCTDSIVNATLVQGELWPEDGGFYLYVDFNNSKPAAWMVGDHLSTSLGWYYEPLSNDSWPPGGQWIWSGSVIIDSVPTTSLEDWIHPEATYP